MIPRATQGLLLVLLHAALAGASSPEAHNSLTRFHDPVVVSTALLQGLTDRRTANYRLYRSAGDKAEPVPFQFDARDADGEIVFPDSTAEQDFVFDDNDELVFMAKDAGDRVRRAALPAGNDTTLEIEVTDPITGSRGWVYLLHFPADPPPRSPIVYATFDTASNEARAEFYTMQYYPGGSFFTGMRIAAAAGGNGENILDRMKIRVNPTFSLLLTTWSPLFTEEDFSVRIDGVKNGPVRAIRRVRQSMDLGTFFPDVPSGTTYTYYYFSSFVTPSKFSIPWLALKSLRYFRFTGVSDFRKNAVGMTYWDGANPQGVRLTGHSHPPMNSMQDHDWWVVGGPGGSCLHLFITPAEWHEWGIARGTVFVDDDTAVDGEGPDTEPGIHAAGYSLLNMTKLRRAGSYDMNLATIILPRLYRPGDEVQPMAMIKQPLQIEVRRVD